MRTPGVVHLVKVNEKEQMRRGKKQHVVTAVMLQIGKRRPVTTFQQFELKPLGLSGALTSTNSYVISNVESLQIGLFHCSPVEHTHIAANQLPAPRLWCIER